MSLGLIKKNSSSPFMLQRSMVDQGGEGGAYESGGFNPDTVYSDGGAASAIVGIGRTMGASLASRTSEDKNKDNEQKSARLSRRAVKTESKKQEAIKSGNVNKAERMKDRGERVESRLKSTNEEIKKYKEAKKPTLTSDIVVDDKKETKKQEASSKASATTNAKINDDTTTKTTDISSNNWRKDILGWNKTWIG